MLTWCCSDLSLIIYTFNRHCLYTFWIESVFPRGNIWLGCLIYIQNKFLRYVMLMNNRRYVSFECKIILKYIGFNYSISFNTPLTQPLVSTIRPPKSFNFYGEFALTTPVPIAMTIFLEITPPARRTPVSTSFTFTRNSSSKRFGLPCLLCTVALLLFLSFPIFLPAIYWCSYKRVFRRFFPRLA